MLDVEYKREGGNFGECKRGFEASSYKTTNFASLKITDR